jgi:uncharacterized protein YegL
VWAHEIPGSAVSQTVSKKIALVALLLFAASARAQDPLGEGLDLLLLVDRSGSMSAHSPAAIVDALPMTLNVLAWSARSARVTHRFGIVSFGSRARLDVPLTVVGAETLPSLRARIAALPSRSLGDTNFIDAFETAADAFRALPDDSRRRRAIVLLTDGHPSGSKVPMNEAIARLVSTQLGTASIDVLLFGDGGELPLWRRISGQRVHRVPRERAEVLATLHRVVTGRTGTRSTQESAETFVLPPYLDLVVFDIFRGAAKDVAVFPPGASTPLGPRAKGVEEVHVGDALTTIVVRRPPAGTWTFRRSDPSARVKVLSQQFFARGVLVDPPAEPPVRQHDDVTIGYRLDDEGGRPLQELPGYPLSVDVSLALPDGSRVVMPMTRGARSALYRTSSPVACSITGRYWTEVLITTADSSGEPVRIFEDRWSGFSVEAGARRVLQAAMVDVISATPPRQQVATTSTRSHLAILAAATVAILALLVALMRRR